MWTYLPSLPIACMRCEKQCGPKYIDLRSLVVNLLVVKALRLDKKCKLSDYHRVKTITQQDRKFRNKNVESLLNAKR